MARDGEASEQREPSRVQSLRLSSLPSAHSLFCGRLLVRRDLLISLHLTRSSR